MWRQESTDWRLSAGTESPGSTSSERQMTFSEPKDRAPVRGPSARLIGGLLVTLGLILAFCLYTVHEIGQLRDEQTRISERNRLDSLQLLRIQNNLSTIATAMRDMADRTEPYPMVSWRQTFDRIKADLEQAIGSERKLAPAERPAAQQARLVGSLRRFWSLVDAAFMQAAAGREEQAATTLRSSATAQHQELVSMVSQFLVLNNRVQEDAAQTNQAIYGRVQREIFILMGALLLIVSITGLYGIAANRRAFEDVRRLSGELRSLSWKMMRMQEDLEEVRGIVQQTLERIRTESRMLHPVILDDFGLENAIQWYVEQFGRQHGIAAQYIKAGPIGVVSPEVAIHIYRIVQEALTNVSRHSGSAHAWVRLRQADDRIELEIEDRGRGLPPEAERREGWRGIGLVSMRERAELMGGEFALTPAPAGGTIVRVAVPLQMATRATGTPEEHEEEARIG